MVALSPSVATHWNSCTPVPVSSDTNIDSVVLWVNTCQTTKSNHVPSLFGCMESHDYRSVVVVWNHTDYRSVELKRVLYFDSV